MASFESIELISRTSWPAGTLAYGGTCVGSAPYPASQAGNLPASVKLTYSPLSVTSDIYDPTKGSGRKWKKIKDSGEISFTPYEHSSVKTSQFIVGRIFDYAWWKFHQQGCAATQTANRFGPSEGHLIYRRNSSFNEWVNYIDSSLWTNTESSHREAIVDAISTTQQSAFALGTSTYDLLTEMAEFKETLAFLQGLVGGAAESLSKFAHTDEPTFKRARGMNAKQLLKSSDKALRKFGSRWMAYRYAIGPLIYSIKDVNELLGKIDSRYVSGRNKSVLNSSVSLSDYSLPSNGVKVVVVGNIDTEVRSLFKSRYDKGALQRLLSQTSFNPFLTAWELVPFSFVVDWFLNVGDAITVASRIDSSTQSLGVTAIRTKSLQRTMLHDTTSDVSNFSTAAWLDQPALTKSYTHNRFVQESLQDIEVNSYRRIVFDRPRPNISFDPSLNWKRILDSLVLSYQPIKKLLRSL